MPLLTQHHRPEITREFVEVYHEMARLRGVGKAAADPGADPGVQEDVPMPFFVYPINLQLTLEPHTFRTVLWPIAVISGSYMLRELGLYRMDVEPVNPSYITWAKFHLKQTATRWNWDIERYPDGLAWDLPIVFAHWDWNDPALTLNSMWNEPINVKDGDVLLLSFTSKVVAGFPSTYEPRYKALLYAFYMPLPTEGIYFGPGERV